jgi:hypothetical protein
MTSIQHYSNFRRRPNYNPDESYKMKMAKEETKISNDEINLFKGGYTVENLNGNNTFINYLIKRRLSSNSSGFSSHIAAFVSKIGTKKQCLLRRKGKHRYRRKL